MTTAPPNDHRAMPFLFLSNPDATATTLSFFNPDVVHAVKEHRNHCTNRHTWVRSLSLTPNRSRPTVSSLQAIPATRDGRAAAEKT
ncbi:hypothetical protein ACSQ67_018034 [Phaseolus vulgaris]